MNNEIMQHRYFIKTVWQNNIDTDYPKDWHCYHCGAKMEL